MKLSTILLTLSVVFLVSTLTAKPSLIVITNLEKMVAIKAVDDVNVAKGLSRLGRTFLPTLQSQLQATKAYQLVNRNDFSTLLKEIDFNASGLVGEPIAKKFKLQGADLIMIVEYIDVEYLANKRVFELTDTTEETITLNATISVKILNTSTAIVEQALPVVEVNLIQVNSQIRVGDKVSSSNLWSKAGSQLATKLVKSLLSVGSPAKVLAVNGKQVLVNKGALFGFEKGLKVKFYVLQKIIDEESGDVFTNEVPVGFGKVVRGDDRKCFVEVGEDLGIAKGCIVQGE